MALYNWQRAAAARVAAACGMVAIDAAAATMAVDRSVRVYV